MKKRICIILASLCCLLTLNGCGEDPELTKFQKNVDDFCNKITTIDTAINNIDPNADDAADQLLAEMDELNILFQSFARLDFPEEFDYLEEIADQSSEYMTTAVENFHKAYSNESYNEYTAEYAKENYSRAYKRIKIIIAFLHGETPDDVDVTVSE